MSRNENIEQVIEQTLYTAGVSNSGAISQVIWEGLEEMSSPIYQYVDEDGQVWFGTDPEGMVDSFGCDISELVGGYFLPAKGEKA